MTGYLKDASVSARCHRLLEYPPPRRVRIVGLLLLLVEVRSQVHIAPAMKKLCVIMPLYVKSYRVRRRFQSRS